MAKRKNTSTKKTPRPGLGVSGVRRPSRQAPTAAKAKIAAYDAAEASTLFGLREGRGGGAGFVQWLKEEGLDLVRRTAEEWGPLLLKFATRPIHGHRRKNGGTHRINQEHRR